MAGIGSLDELLHLDLSDAARQWHQVISRDPYVPGRRQADFVAVEVVLCHGAALLVNHWSFGGTTAGGAPEPVQLLGHLFRRPPTSVLAKMANLDGSRPHGAKFDHAAGLVWSVDPRRFESVYAIALFAARRVGISDAELPDFLDPAWDG